MNINKRMRDYRKNFQTKRPIELAINKYGLDDFQINVIYFPEHSKTELLDLEEIYIIECDCIVPKGYNICARGQDRTNIKHTEESKLKMSDSALNPTIFKRRKMMLSAHSRKLSPDNIPEIFRMRSEGKTQKVIANHFNVGQDQICRILSGKRWSSL